MDKWNLLKKLFAEQIQEKRNDQKNLLDERERLSSKIREIELLIEGLEEELEKISDDSDMGSHNLSYIPSDNNAEVVLAVLKRKITPNWLLIREIEEQIKDWWSDLDLTYRQVEVALEKLIQEERVEQTNKWYTRNKRYGLHHSEVPF